MMSNASAFWLVWFGAALGCALCFASLLVARTVWAWLRERWDAWLLRRRMERRTRSARYVAGERGRTWR